MSPTPIPTLSPIDQIGIISVSSNADDIALAGVLLAITIWIMLIVIVWSAIRIANIRQNGKIKKCMEENKSLRKQLEVILLEMNSG